MKTLKFQDSSDWPPFENEQSQNLSLPFNPRPLLKWGAVIIGLILILLSLNFLRGVYTNILWFDNLGYRHVYVNILTTKVWLFFLGAVIPLAFIVPSLIFAHKKSQGDPIIPIEPETLILLRRLFKFGVIIGTIIIAMVFGYMASAQWESMLRFINEAPFTTIDSSSGERILAEDPVFHKNIAFYVFTIPIINIAQELSLAAVIVLIISTLSVYLVNLTIRGVNFVASVTPAMISHASILLLTLLLVITWGYWIDIYQLMFSTSGAVFGPAYTDLNARLPALRLLIIIGALVGITLLVNIRLRSVRTMVICIGICIAAAIISGVYPTLVQRFQVDPDELAREREYIPRNIEFTRKAFALDRIEENMYPFSPALTTELVVNNPETIDNMRLWDHRPIRDVYNQKQFFRAYYRFVDVDIDRYNIDGESRQVMLAARELFSEDLPEGSQSWVNQRLQYTHGYGVAMSPVTEFTQEGQPNYFIKNIPPSVSGKIENGDHLRIDQPQVYYGENTKRYTIVNTSEPEFDYPAISSDVPVRTRYQGLGGVNLDSLVRRVAYALEFRDINILISGSLLPESRIQYTRDIHDRVAKIAPFLTLDNDPYLVVSEGKLFWIQDAYTTTNQYPNSEPYRNEFNYIRNSIKAVISAYDGTIDFYIFDKDDAIIQTYDKVFPNMFKPQEEMPKGLLDHIRYPQDFFSIQAERYQVYHMRDTTDFYNMEDPWSIPSELFFEQEQQMEPYYVIMKLPGEEKEEFVLLMPFTPLDKPNLVAWMAARSDNDKGQYGSLVSFLFPKGTAVDGPEQVEARIDNDFTIKQQFTLLCQRGASCIRGNLLVIPLIDPNDPLNATLVYVEPLYIQSETLDFPELKQVIVADANHVAMEGDLTTALNSLLSASDQSIGKEYLQEIDADINDESDSIADSLKDQILNIKTAFSDLNTALQGLLDSLEEEK